MMMTTNGGTRTSEGGTVKPRRPDPIEPDLQTILFTIAMSLVGVMLAIQADNALGRSLAWASILGYLILGATVKIVTRRRLQENPLPDRIWIVLLCMTSIYEFVAMMVVWGGMHP